MQLSIVTKSKFLAESSIKKMKAIHYVPSAEFSAPTELSKKIYIGGHSMYEIEKAKQIVCDFMNAIERGDMPELRE